MLLVRQLDVQLVKEGRRNVWNCPFMICFVWSNCQSHFPLDTRLYDHDPLLLLHLLRSHILDLLQHKRQLPEQPDFVGHMWFAWQHRDVARRPVLHPAGHGGAADHSVCRPGGQRLPGMPLWRLSRKKRRKEPTTVDPQSHRTVLEIRNSDCNSMVGAVYLIRSLKKMLNWW